MYFARHVSLTRNTTCKIQHTRGTKLIRLSFPSLVVANDKTEEETMINLNAIHLRSYFPQSWMWTFAESDHTGTVR